ncbi:MAG TPA: hypothetical protein VGE07_04995 [Herpetosiphonaceae bacterium]
MYQVPSTGPERPRARGLLVAGLVMVAMVAVANRLDNVTVAILLYMLMPFVAGGTAWLVNRLSARRGHSPRPDQPPPEQ